MIPLTQSGSPDAARTGHVIPFQAIAPTALTISRLLVYQSLTAILSPYECSV